MLKELAESNSEVIVAFTHGSKDETLRGNLTGFEPGQGLINITLKNGLQRIFVLSSVVYVQPV